MSSTRKRKLIHLTPRKQSQSLDYINDLSYTEFTSRCVLVKLTNTDKFTVKQAADGVRRKTEYYYSKLLHSRQDGDNIYLEFTDPDRQKSDDNKTVLDLINDKIRRPRQSGPGRGNTKKTEKRTKIEKTIDEQPYLSESEEEDVSPQHSQSPEFQTGDSSQATDHDVPYNHQSYLDMLRTETSIDEILLNEVMADDGYFIAPTPSNETNLVLPYQSKDYHAPSLLQNEREMVQATTENVSLQSLRSSVQRLEQLLDTSDRQLNTAEALANQLLQTMRPTSGYSRDRFFQAVNPAVPSTLNANRDWQSDDFLSLPTTECELTRSKKW